jgi:hypothetical protein
MEEYRPVKEFQSYSVSDQGHVKNSLTDRVLKPGKTINGLPYVALRKDGKTYVRSVPTLVAQVFLPPPKFDSCDTVMHIDFNRDNNIVENLCWRPRWFVLEYRDQINWPNKGFVIPIKDLETGAVYPNCWDAALTHGLVAMHISRAMSEGLPVFPTLQLFAFVDDIYNSILCRR